MTILHALILSLPARNSTVRMRAWRALKDSGCGVLRDGVYVLPASATASAALGEVESGIRSSGGFAMRVELHLKTDEQRAHLRGLFDRSSEYAALADGIKATRASIRRLGPRKAKTSLDRLQRHVDRLAAIDFYPGAAKSQVADALASLQRDFRGMYAQGEPRISRRRLRPGDRATYQARVWATRKDPWVDRLASAWLIKRFIDPAARFVWLDRPSGLPRKAIGYDFDGAQFTHVGNRVTFEVLMETFGLDGDPALAAIGASVHFLDVGGNSAADAKGLETVLKGVKEKAPDDDAMLSEAMRIFDHFYSAYAERKTA
ncbi:MAG TPA: chromate resistance protein ChrB domain-containing protein [Burkholderiales bacterium]|nr:chromate resistance protein ChrB domain-containing protein [Burkholderiales bacterium]